MSEAKQNHTKNRIEYFSKDRDTNIISNYDQLTKKSSFDSPIKTSYYTPVIFSRINGNNAAIPVENTVQNDLSKSRKNKNSGENNLSVTTLPLLLKNTSVDNQTNNILKIEVRKKNRLLVKRGVTSISLLLNDIALIFSKGKLVYVIDRDSKKYSIDKTLSELEEELDDSIFFRVNRQYIVNLNFIKGFKAYQKVKLLVDINVLQLEKPVIISQHLAPAFKKWMNDA